MDSKRGKKRPRSSSPGRVAAEPAMDAAYLCSNTIRLVMGPDVPILSLVDFIRKYAPDLPKLPPLHDTPDDLRLRHTLFCPSDTLKSASRCTKVRCPESLDSLVDDVIWTMVQRRGPWNSNERDTRNVLSNGYVVASDRTRHVQPCPNMRPGVVCIRINSNVSFCKTSTYFQRLYDLVGDDVLRMILLHTSVFLPVEDDWEDRRGNYLQVCGPTLHPKPIHLPGQILRETTVTSDIEPKQAKVINSWAPNAVISRQSMFYSSAYVPKVGLPDKHELNAASATTLLQSMLHVKSMSDSKKRKCWKGLRRVGVPLCEQIMKQHAKCDYARLLERYCPLPDFAASRRDPGVNTSPSLSEASASHSPAEGVASFLRAVCRRVFPLEFWGSAHNLDKMCELLGSFVNLRRHEQLPNKALMKGLRVTDMRWLLGRDDENRARDTPKKPDSGGRRKLSRSQHESTTGLSLRVIRWVFCKFVIPLLRSTFYITESEMHAKRVLYYRRPVWSLFRALSVKKLLTRQYQEIDRTEALDRLEQQRMGLSRLRLLPKNSGVRPLVLLSNRPGVVATESGPNIQQITAEPSTKPLATNSILRNTFEVLSYENLQQPEARGAGVFGVNEAYPLLRDFLQTFRSESPRRPLFFASVDIEHCYDNINQHRLLDIIKNLLTEDDYLIQNCAVMYPFKSMGRIFKRRLREVGPPEAFRQFHDASHELSQDRRNSVFLDGVGCTTAKKDQILELLEEHLTSHLVVLRGRFGDRFFIQSSGIPQGSILSSLLCNFYYGHVEKELLGPDFSPTSDRPASDHIHLLLRIVDDFLLITTDRSFSAKFISAMTKGDDRLGVHINDDKTCVSHSTTVEAPDGKTLQLKSACILGEVGKSFFPWCGLMFDIDSGELRLDLSRFFGDKSVDGLTVDRSGSEGRQLRIRMNSFVRPRCLAIMFDPTINSLDTVCINFHQAILICAVKTARYVTDGMSKADRNIDFILRCMEDVILFAHKLIAERLSREASALFCLEETWAMFLGRHAFVNVFCDLDWATTLAQTLQAKCDDAAFDGKDTAVRLANVSTDQFCLHCM